MPRWFRRTWLGWWLRSDRDYTPQQKALIITAWSTAGLAIAALIVAVIETHIPH